jgi:hypothetical protein
VEWAIDVALLHQPARELGADFALEETPNEGALVQRRVGHNGRSNQPCALRARVVAKR